MAAGALALGGCATQPAGEEPRTGGPLRARLLTALAEINDGPCLPGQLYVQEPLREPVRIAPHGGVLKTEMVMRIRERCVPVWVQTPEPHWEMQTLKLRTYGFPRDPNRPITEADADDPDSPQVAWSAPGPTWVMTPASEPGAPDGTAIQIRLYNRMPHDSEPHGCDTYVKCNTQGENAGVDPVTGECKVPPDTNLGGVPEFVPHQVVNGKVVEPPNCFHGDNSTNLHFHGFHVSSQLGQDFIGLELRPPLPRGVAQAQMPAHGTHGEEGVVRYGHFDYAIDPLRYTQAPGTHWYHAHKHGSTALQVLNGAVGAAVIHGDFDEALDAYFEAAGGGPLVDRLLVVQQLQEELTGRGGVDQKESVLVNGQANPIVTMAAGEVQRWRFVGAMMQASAALRIGFPEVSGKASPEVRQIAMDGVQFSPENYACQPFLNKADCSPPDDDSALDETTAFALDPGVRVDVLVKAPLTPGTHCMVYDVTTELPADTAEEVDEAQEQQATLTAGTCGIDPNTNLGPLFTLVIEDAVREMTFPTPEQFPPMAPYLADIPPVTDPALERDVFYEMFKQANLPESQFWIDQQKYDPQCANQTFVIDQPQQWTLWNNSGGIAHPFHIHQNPFQLVAQSNRSPSRYRYPVWRDTLAIPKAAATVDPNSDPATNGWGNAELLYVAKEFTGMFVNHCHILGHEDRGMMQNVQAVCPDGDWATTGEVPPGERCDPEGFCPGDCETGKPIPPADRCPDPPAQTSDWPKDYGIKE
jgi:FtsP/CotA-like multicopper oxidase with cupredoxin domain